MKLTRRLLSVLGIVVAAAGARAQQPPAANPGTLTVYAAASLTDAFTDLGGIVEREHPGTRVQFNFAGSQQLALQLDQGAPADVFASADQRWMDHAREHEMIAGAPAIFARNRLVVIVPKTNPARIKRLEDLGKRGLKLVLAAEAVPVGKYSREALQNLGGAPGFPPDYAKRVLGNVVSQEDNVKGVVAKVQLGEADAGMVYLSDVTPNVERYVSRLDIPDQFNVVASYPIAVVKGATNPVAARAFVDLVLSAEGQGVLQKHGLMAP